MDVQGITEVLKALEAAKPALEGAVAAGTLLSAGGKASVYVLQKGAMLISYLITARKKKKGDTALKKPAGAVAEAPKVTKPDVAIIVDINHRSLKQVADYLNTQGVDADFIIITNDPAYSDKVQFLDVRKPEEWDAVLHDFGAAILKIERTVGSAHVHIFQTTPLPLAFGLGCVWGAVHPATVYHYQDGTYHPVLQVKRDWKQG